MEHKKVLGCDQLDPKNEFGPWMIGFGRILNSFEPKQV